MNKLARLEMKYARGGRVSTPHALAAVQRAQACLSRGDHKGARACLEASPDAMAHPHVRAAHAMLAPPTEMGSYDEGGEVRPSGSSSPGSPGILGAIHDAVHALKDYLIDRPARENAAASESMVDKYTSSNYAEGGKVSAAKEMAKFLQEKMGFSADHAQRMADQYHSSTQASPVAKGLADQAVSMVAPAARVKKAPAQLAQELSAGHVDPADLQHLLYTDPQLTALINRYQSGVDNQNLTAQQKAALIQKLQALGGQAPPQLPQRGMPAPPAQAAPPQMQPPPVQPATAAASEPPGAQIPGGGPPLQ